MVTEAARRRFGGWREGELLSFDEEFGSLAAEVVARCLFSSDCDQETADRIAEDLPHLMTWVGSRGFDPTGLLARLPTGVNRRFRAGNARMHATVDRILAERRGTDRGEGDLLAMLQGARDAESGDGMSDRQVHDEAMTVLAAGTDTVSHTLSWCAYLLARNPDVQDRLHAETDRELAGREPGYDDVERLVYMRMVLSEVLRMYPAGYLVSRSATADTVLGGRAVPAGTMVLISTYALHRDPAYFPDPDTFDPDRWSEEALPPRGRPVKHYLPFGLGPHGCVGEAFAWTQMAMVLATLANRWSLHPVTDRPVEPVPTFTLTTGALPLRVRRRHARR
ncbi:cytochrome P450 [Streptomyces pratensis]|uniref:cytochrome P450 n=1 Tax=Streptomyces pratensis TaxID=1169025 RepID=UPI0036446525